MVKRPPPVTLKHCFSPKKTICWQRPCQANYNLKMFNQKRRKSVLIMALVLALLVAGAIACWLNRELIWPKTTDDYVFTDHMTQANNYLSEGNSDGVIAELNEALRIKPDSGDARLKLAIALDDAGRYSESVECYRTGLKYQPDSEEFLNNLAWLLVSCPDASLRNGPQRCNWLRSAAALQTIACLCLSVGWEQPMPKLAGSLKP